MRYSILEDKLQVKVKTQQIYYKLIDFFDRILTASHNKCISELKDVLTQVFQYYGDPSYVQFTCYLKLR